MIQYLAIKEQHYQKEIGEYISWGIKGYRSTFETSGEPDVYISDIFSNEKEAMEFAKLCTEMKLSFVHLADYLDDYIGQ